MTMRKLTRKFDGKIYEFQGTHKTKKLTEEHREKQKKKGYLVRIVKLTKGYAIYVKLQAKSKTIKKKQVVNNSKINYEAWDEEGNYYSGGATIYKKGDKWFWNSSSEDTSAGPFKSLKIAEKDYKKFVNSDEWDEVRW